MEERQVEALEEIGRQLALLNSNFTENKYSELNRMERIAECLDSLNCEVRNK